MLLTLGWILLSLSFRELVPHLWAWGAFPGAIAAAAVLYGLKLRTTPSLIIILLFPWLIRLFLFGLSSAVFQDLPVYFDNGWLLTAPYLYFASLSFYLSLRYPRSGYIETILSAGFAVFLLSRDGLWPESSSLPVAESLSLAVSVLLVVLTALSFAALRRDDEFRTSGYALAPRRRQGVAGALLHWSILSAVLLLLILGGNRIRREQSIRSGGGLLASDMFRFDFSDVLSLEPEISMNAEITMLYRENGPATLRYLRRYTLSGWDDDRGFFRDGDMEIDVLNPPTGDGVPTIPVTLPRGPISWPNGGFLARTEIEQEYYLIALDPESFFALNYPISVEPWTIWDDASFSRAYAARSRVSVAGPWELMDSGESTLSVPVRDYYLQGGSDSYFAELAEEISGGMEDRWSKVASIERWFHENYYYSLNPGLAPDGDQLGWFLQESRRGYCSYFAFAMTRLCRAAGIPSRVAVGFLTDPETSTLGFVPVRSDQAHAWVEVWFDEYGWISFDPTSPVMAPGEDYPFQFISPEEWLPLIEEVLTRSGEVSVALDEGGAESGEPELWWEQILSLAENRPVLPWSAVALAFVTAYIPRRLLPGAKRLLFSLSSEPRLRCQGSWRLFAGRLSRGGYGPKNNETALDWAGRLERDGMAGFSEWTALYLKAEYSPQFDSDDGEESRELKIAVIGSWRQKPSGRRLRSFFGLGWIGGFPW